MAQAIDCDYQSHSVQSWLWRNQAKPSRNKKPNSRTFASCHLTSRILCFFCTSIYPYNHLYLICSRVKCGCHLFWWKESTRWLKLRLYLHFFSELQICWEYRRLPSEGQSLSSAHAMPLCSPEPSALAFLRRICGQPNAFMGTIFFTRLADHEFEGGHVSTSFITLFSVGHARRCPRWGHTKLSGNSLLK